MIKQMSQFSSPRGLREPASSGDAEGADVKGPMPDMDDPRVLRAMNEMERDMAYMDENNPKDMARMMRKMQQILPQDAMPKELETAIKRLEAGEDPEKIEEDMGDVLGDFMGGNEGEGEGGDEYSGSGGGGRYTRDSGLYDL